VPGIAGKFPHLLSKFWLMIAHSAVLVGLVWYHVAGVRDKREIASYSVFRVIMGVIVADFRFCAITNLIFSLVLCVGLLFHDAPFLISEASICAALWISQECCVVVAEHFLELQASMGAQWDLQKHQSLTIAQSREGVEGGFREPKHEPVLLKTEPSEDNVALVSEPVAVLLFDSLDPDLHIIEVSDEWTRLFGEATGTLFGWLGPALMVDFQIWIAKLVRESELNGWSAANAKHKFRRVACTLPSGSRVSVMISLTMLDPGDHVTEKKYLATLSAESVREKGRHPLKLCSHCNHSRSSRSSKRGPAMPIVPEGEDKSNAPITTQNENGTTNFDAKVLGSGALLPMASSWSSY